MNGLCIQWGTFTTNSSGNSSVAFPVNFTNVNYRIIAVIEYSSNPDACGYKTSTKAVGSVTIGVRGAGSGVKGDWIAIGY